MRIVVLGAGFGGLRCALELDKRLAGTDHEIFLVDRHPYHLITPALYQVAAIEAICRSVTIPIREILAPTRIDFIRDNVISIDTNRRLVRMAGRDLSYDYLVLALGSQTDFYGIPGLEEHALPLKTVYDAGRVRLKLRRLLENNVREPKRIIVGGGGFTGCELVGEIVLAVDSLMRKHGVPRANVDVAVVEGADQLLPGLPLKVAERVKKRLERLGVNLYLGRRIVKVNSQQIELSSGEMLGYDILVWTGGVCASDVAIDHEVKKAKRRCIVVDEYLRCGTHEFVIGDLAYCIEPSTKEPLPGTIPIAAQEGKLAAINIVRLLKGLPLKRYRPRHSGYIIPLTGKYAIAMFELPGKPVISGRPAYLMFQFVLLRYFLQVLTPVRALRCWRNWRLDVSRDMVRTLRK